MAKTSNKPNTTATATKAAPVTAPAATEAPAVVAPAAAPAAPAPVVKTPWAAGDKGPVSCTTSSVALSTGVDCAVVPCRFTVEYKSRPGQTVSLCGSLATLGAWNSAKAVAMQYTAGDVWTCEVEVAVDTVFEYKYIVDGQYECGLNRRAQTDAPTIFADTWSVHGNEVDRMVATAFFADVVYHREPEAEADQHKHAANNENLVNVDFVVYAPLVAPTEVVRITGTPVALGNNDHKCAISMSGARFPMWHATVSMPASSLTGAKFQFIVADKASGTVTATENGLRTLPTIHAGVRSVRVSGGVFRATNPAFHPRAAGTCIPVFSLRSDRSCGCGDFADLKLMGDLCNRMGLRLLQLLPVNDTMTHINSWLDTYPYSPLSVFALHPMYVALDLVEGVSEELKQRIAEKAKELDFNKMDYEATLAFKIQVLEELFARASKDDVARRVADFEAKNTFWSVPYAVFKALAGEFGTQDFAKWPAAFQPGMDADEIRALYEGTYTGADAATINAANVVNRAHFWMWVQSILDEQLTDATEYCRSKSVGLKGDIPIGVDPRSADVWTWPQWFCRKFQAGAPPDAFSHFGQNWGFPTFDWEKMEADGFGWWRHRLGVMSRYFSAYRIDHILGFFRIWSVPQGNVSGMRGYFRPSQPIYRDWLVGQGFPGDLERFTQPWMPEHYIREVLGEEADYAMKTFMEYDLARGYQHYRFRKEFEQEVAIEEVLARDLPAETTEEDREAHRLRCSRYWTLTGNVLLVPDVDNPFGSFYPKYGLNTTNSFAELQNEHQKNVLTKYMNDYFYEWHDDMWSHAARTKFREILGKNRMLVCGEDLGLLAPCVPRVMDEFALLGLRVQRMPADPAVTFQHPADYDYAVVATPATHDMEPVRLWWATEEQDKKQYYWNHMLGNYGAAPENIDCMNAQRLLDMHIYSPAVISVLQIQDLLVCDDRVSYKGPALDERINVPAIAQFYWRWRLHTHIENLIEDDEFVGGIRTRVARAGRLDYH